MFLINLSLCLQSLGPEVLFNPYAMDRYAVLNNWIAANPRLYDNTVAPLNRGLRKLDTHLDPA